MEILFTIMLMMLSATIGFLTCSILSINHYEGGDEMRNISFSKGIDIITIEDCINCNNNGIDVIMNEGKEVTFEIN